MFYCDAANVDTCRESLTCVDKINPRVRLTDETFRLFPSRPYIKGSLDFIFYRFHIGFVRVNLPSASSFPVQVRS